MSTEKPTASAPAGLTKGALFRHFAIKGARVIAAAEHPAPQNVGLTRLNALPKEETR
jgi:hypothetical protein